MLELVIYLAMLALMQFGIDASIVQNVLDCLNDPTSRPIPEAFSDMVSAEIMIKGP